MSKIIMMYTDPGDGRWEIGGGIEGGKKVVLVKKKWGGGDKMSREAKSEKRDLMPRTKKVGWEKGARGVSPLIWD